MIKKHINKICFIILNILVVLIFLPWLSGHYATDTYNIINVGYEYYSIHNSLLDGRVFMFFIIQLAAFLNIKIQVLNFIMLFLALLISNFSVLIVKNIVFKNIKTKDVKTEIFSYLIAYTFIYNFMYIENLYFLESFVMALSILINLIAAKIFAEKRQRYILKTIIYILISVFCYQGTISSFLAFVILFEALKKQSLKNIVKNTVLAIIILGVSSICNLIFIKIISNNLGVQQTRINSEIINNILYVFKTKLNTLIDTSDHFYYGLFLVYVILFIGCFIYAFKFNDNKEKYFIFFVCLIFGVLFCTDLPYLISGTAQNAGRTRFAIGALCSILTIYILSNIKEIKEKHKKHILSFLCSFMIIYFIVNIVNYIEIIHNTKIKNECEKAYVENINKYISEYEIKNNTIIEKIQLVQCDDANNAFYSSCTRKNVMTWNACSCVWSAVGVINFYTNRNLIPQSDIAIRIEMKEMYEIIDDVLYVKIEII